MMSKVSKNDIIESTKNCPQCQLSGWNNAKFLYYAWQLLSNFETEIISLP